MKLCQMASISMGILTSREKNQFGLRKYSLFDIKNYEENIEYEVLCTHKDFDEKLTKQDDLLFRLVYPNKIVYVNKEQENLLIPSQLCIIRTNKKILNPVFLKWYLESKIGREKIMLEMKGSSIQKISVASLKNIEIPELEIEKQRNIEDLINLWQKEKETLEKLIENKQKLYNSIIEEIVMEREKNVKSKWNKSTALENM